MPHRCAFRHLATALLLLATSFLSGCATHYLDKGTPEVPVAQFKKVASPSAAQLAFEFQTNGAPNARATELLKEQITKQVQESGLFAKLSEAPASNGALLSITLNNIADTDEAMKKGFVTGLTFGAKGSTIVDGYLCTIKYLPPSNKTAITATAKHALYTSMGSESGAEPGIKIENVEQGIRTMFRQILSQALNKLSHDPAFQKATVVP